MCGQDPEAATYRHYAGVTARRGGFFYTFIGTAPDAVWAEVEPAYRGAVDSFRLTPPGPGFVAPDALFQVVLPSLPF